MTLSVLVFLTRMPDSQINPLDKAYIYYYQLTLERELYQKQFETPLSKEQLININNQLKQIEIQLETYETQWFELTEQVM